MDIALFSMGGLQFILRWIHFLSGVTWIGTLYYFNFIQGPYFNEIDAPTKTQGQAKLLSRAMWWFRWGAMLTFISGICYLGMPPMVFNNSRGILILAGATLGTIMFLNVWLIIWPAQKIVIASAEGVLKGQPGNPAAAAAGARGLLASRTNTLFSFPMLFFMGAASHLGIRVNPMFNPWPLVIVLGVIIGALELNAIKGKLGPMTTIRGVIHMGIVLALVLYGVVEFLTK